LYSRAIRLSEAIYCLDQWLQFVDALDDTELSVRFFWASETPANAVCRQNGRLLSFCPYLVSSNVRLKYWREKESLRFFYIRCAMAVESA
jgi:hypothetical protein